MSTPTLVALLAFALGCGFGALSSATRFCTMGAVADVVNMGDWARARAWALAIATAVIGTQALAALGLIDLSKTFYTAPDLRWLSHLVGGLMFGIGMPLASGCGARLLVRLGGGNLKSLVTLVFFGLSAYATLRGLFGTWRVSLLDPVTLALPAHSDAASLLAHATGWASVPAITAAAAAVAGVLLVSVFRRGCPGWATVAGGLGVGGCVILGWWISGVVGYLAEDPNTLQEAFVATNSTRMESLSFAAPIAYLIELFVLWSDESRTLTFGIAAALGTIFGATAHSLASGRFRVESFINAEDLSRHLIGATLMGAGGVTALGCTIGQGVSGVATLAVGSFITLVGIVAGCWAMLKFDEWRLMRQA